MSIHINQIETYFNEHGIPTEPVRLDSATVVVESEIFINSHLSILKANPGNQRFIAYYDRLVAFYLTDKKNNHET